MKIISEESLHIICAEEIETISILVQKEKREDVKALLNRALNCWDTAPQWLHDFADHLNGVPERYSERDKAA